MPNIFGVFVNKIKKNKEINQKEFDKDISKNNSDNHNNIELYNDKLVKINNFIENKHKEHKEYKVEEEVVEEEAVEEEKKVLENILQNEEEEKSDNFINYIIQDSIVQYGKNVDFCRILWSGIGLLEHWELQRQLDKVRARKIMNEMKKDYKENNSFIFYDPIHLAVKNDGKYYVIDGQHRLVAYYTLFSRNKYPIQQIPCVIWKINESNDNNDDFLKLFDRINLRTPLDHTRLINYKIKEVIKEMTNEFGKDIDIWGSKRPKIDKDLFIKEIRENQNINNMDIDQIINKIKEINNSIRGMSRNKRTKERVSPNIHKVCEELNFFLSYDKSLSWISQI